MKTLKEHIIEGLKIGAKTKVNTVTYKYHPKNRLKLKELIEKLVKERGENADLNDIDVSGTTDMSYVFFNSKFNGDISKWDVSKVTDMCSMFYNSKFNGDISNWDVGKVTNMSYMFMDSEFNGDISNWDVSNVEVMNHMFDKCPLEKNPLKWYKE